MANRDAIMMRCSAAVLIFHVSCSVVMRVDKSADEFETTINDYMIVEWWYQYKQKWKFIARRRKPPKNEQFENDRNVIQVNIN